MPGNVMGNFNFQRTHMTQNHPKVSIIIPVYNMERHIENCLNHVRTQSLQDIEILCYDDGSQDNTLAMLHRYAEVDSRIRILSGPNQGAGPARNACLHVATGEFVSFLDADDEYYERTSLEQLYLEAKKNGVNLCGGSTYKVRRQHHVYSGKQTELKEGLFTPGEYQDNFGYQRFIYNRSFLLKNGIFFPNYIRYQDPPFFLKAQIIAKNFFCIPKFTYRQNIYKKSLSFFNKNRVNSLLDGLYDDITVCKNYSMYNLLKRKISHITLIYSNNFIKSYLQGNENCKYLIEKINNSICFELIKDIFPYKNKDIFITPLLEIKKIEAIKHNKFSNAKNLQYKIRKIKLAWAKEASKIDPYDMSYRTIYINMLRSIKDFGVAYQETAKLINDFPDDSTGWIQQSFLEEQQGKLPQALDCAYRAVELEPEYPDIYEHFCNMLRANGQTEEAEETARMMIEKHPDQGWPWRQLSWLESDRGHGYLSLKYARKSVEVEPDKLDLRPWLVNLLQREGLHTEARNVLDDTLEKDPWCDWALLWKIQDLFEGGRMSGQQNYCDVFPLLQKAILLKNPQYIHHDAKRYVKALYRSGRMEAFSQSASLGMKLAERVRMALWYGLPGWLRQARLHGERA